MKTIQLLLYCFVVFSLYGQQPSNKGVSPLADNSARISSGPTPAKNTYAVVVGISDYQDPGIPDLRFADKDAEAFANFLRSPVGGQLDGDHLKVLTNGAATLAQISIALDWLVEVVKAGENAVIYFSGHGDVESKRISQPGYLLGWDAPARVYMAGGAVKVSDLQDIVSTLSVTNKARVVLITDACRSGKLSGSEINGAQLTGQNLAKQFSNEIKILSCQANEYSIEGEQWGGGRGAFSYNLVDALYGLADANNDLTVSLQEVGRYLEDHVTAEVAPVTQVPMVVGNRTESMAQVDPILLADLRSGKANQTNTLSPIDSRGIEDVVLATVDTSVRLLYSLFKQALKAQAFLEPANACADAYYERLIAEPKMQRLHSTMRRNYAAALQDEAQQVLNKFLITDPATVDNIYANPIKYDHIPARLHRAAELLGERHYMYKTLKAKEYFFLAKKTRQSNYPTWSLDSIFAVKKKLLLEGISYDSLAPYLYEAFGEFNERDTAANGYVARAVELAPSWPLAHLSYGYTFHWLRDQQSSIAPFYAAIRLDSNLLRAYDRLAQALDNVRRPVEGSAVRKILIRKFNEKYARDSGSVTAFEMASVVNTYWHTYQYKNEERWARMVIRKSNGQWWYPYLFLAHSLADQNRIEECIQAGDSQPDKVSYHYTTLGNIAYYYLDDTMRAKGYFQKGYELSKEQYTKWPGDEAFYFAHFLKRCGDLPKALEVLSTLKTPDFAILLERGDLLQQIGKKQEAVVSYQEIVNQIKPEFIADQNEGILTGGCIDFVIQIIALQRLGRKAEMDAALAAALEAPHRDGWRHFWLAAAFAQIGQPEAAIKHLELSEKAGWRPNWVTWIFGTTKDFHLDPLRGLPAFQAWEKRWLPPYKDHGDE